MNSVAFRVLQLLGSRIQWEASCLTGLGHDYGRGNGRYISKMKTMGLRAIRGSSGVVVKVS
jgi:hypothetical protein